jgi:hypothetical protein
MHATWPRWLLGAWAVLTTAWLVAASLMLVQAWPEPSVGGDHEQFFRSTADDATISALVDAQRASAEREHITRFLLLAIAPPAFLFALVWTMLRVAGLPFPSIRRGPRE